MKKKFITKKSLGQNFLINKGILSKIIIAGNVGADDTIVEVGPGNGALTEELLATGARVIAIEKDRRLIEELKTTFAGRKFIVIEEDVLEIDVTTLGLEKGEYKIIANIPYYITSHFMRDIFEKWPRPHLAVLMVQREVAQRIMAKPGDMNLLALSVGVYAHVDVIMKVSRGSFSPPPNVDSAIIRIIPKENIPDRETLARFFNIIKAGFSQKRKLLIRNLVNELHVKVEDIEPHIQNLGLPLKIRAEELSLEQWLDLAKVL